MSTIRALLPRPAVSYAPRVVAFFGILSSSTEHCPCRCAEISIARARIVDVGIEHRESRRKRGRRRGTCDRVNVAPASLRWATMVAYIWIISKQPKVSSHTKWYIRILWLARRPRHVSGRYVRTLLFSWWYISITDMIFQDIFITYLLWDFFSFFHPIFIISFLLVSVSSASVNLIISLVCSILYFLGHWSSSDSHYL